MGNQNSEIQITRDYIGVLKNILNEKKLIGVIVHDIYATGISFFYRFQELRSSLDPMFGNWGVEQMRNTRKEIICDKNLTERIKQGKKSIDYRWFNELPESSNKICFKYRQLWADWFV